jgi:transposase
LVKDRTTAKNREKVLTLPLLKCQNAQRLEQINRQIAIVEAAILQIVEANAGLFSRFAILTSIPGVSSITAFALLIEMPKLGAFEAGQAGSLVGPAPIARQSGRWTGRLHSRRARWPAPGALHASVAAGFNPDLKAQIPPARPRRKTRQSRHERIIRKLIALATALLKAKKCIGFESPSAPRLERTRSGGA